MTAGNLHTTVAGCVRAILCAFLLAACTQRSTERAGHFAIHTAREDAFGHTSSRISLIYRGRALSKAVSDWSVDPHDPDRIVYASREPCGTFLFDGASGDLWSLADREVIVHAAGDDTPDFAGSTPWSPDGRFLWIGNDIAAPVVVDLQSHKQFDLGDALSAGGRRLPVDAVLWSPDSRRIAAVLQPGGYNDPDRDLIAVTVSSLSAEYVATMTDSVAHGLVLWTTKDFHWEGGMLTVAPAGRRGPIVVRPAGQVRWSPVPPTAPPERMGQQCQ